MGDPSGAFLSMKVAGWRCKATAKSDCRNLSTAEQRASKYAQDVSKSQSKECLSANVGQQAGRKNSYPISHLLYPPKNIPQRAMMRKQLNLSRTIEKHVILSHIAVSILFSHHLPPIRPSLTQPKKLTSQPPQPPLHPLPLLLQLL